MFFLDAFLDLIFLHFMLEFAEKIDFWTPFGIRWGPKWRPNRPNGAKNLPISSLRSRFCANLEPTASRIAFATLLRTILVDFGWNFDEMLMVSDTIFRDSLLHFSRNFLSIPV